jgi:hypothetical protein
MELAPAQNAMTAVEEYVHCATTTRQEKQVIEFLEQEGRRLMNCAQNCLSVIGELLQERENRPRRLTVQSRCGLIKEEKKLRLCRKLDRDGKTLALFDIEA